MMTNEKSEAKACLILMFTDKCNLRCEYCFLRNEENRNENLGPMSLETGRKAVDLYWEMFNLSENSAVSTIDFYGGEPLTNPNLMGVVKHIREKDEEFGVRTRIMVNTNGTLITEEFARKAKEYNLFIVVSLDGPKDVHDRYRKDWLGEGSYDGVIKGIGLLQKEGVETMISTVLTPSNLDSAKNILPIVRKLGVKKAIVSPIFGNSLGNYNLKEEYYQKFAIAAKQYFEEAARNGIEELQIKAKMDSFDLGVPVISAPDIGSSIDGGNQIVIWPNSNVSLCEVMMDLTIGNLNTPIVELAENKNELVQKLRKRLPEFNKECRDCKFAKMCGGECAYSAEEITGDVMRKDPVSCEYNKKLFNLFASNKKIES